MLSRADEAFWYKNGYPAGIYSFECWDWKKNAVDFFFFFFFFFGGAPVAPPLNPPLHVEMCPECLQVGDTTLGNHALLL